MSPLLVLALLTALTATATTAVVHSQQLNYYGNGYPGYPELTGDIATPGDNFYCTPTFTVTTPQQLLTIGVRYECNDAYTDTYNIIMGLYSVSDSTGQGVHTLVAAANEGYPTQFSGACPANVKLQLDVGNFTYIEPAAFSGLLQPGLYYAGCFNTDQQCPILWQNPVAGPQPNNLSDPTIDYPYGNGTLPTQLATNDAFDGGEFVYVTTINTSDNDDNSVDGSGVSSTGGGGAAASVVGDPMFVGLLGQSYQVHGISGAVYSLISDAQVQVNARFTFIKQGTCLRDADGSPLFTCWSHPGSYLSDVAVRTAAGDTIVVSAGNAEYGFRAVLVNGVAISVGELVSLHSAVAGLAALSISYSSVRVVTIVNAGLYTLTLQNSDGFVNIDRLYVTSMQQLRDTVRSHGLIGQTWQRRMDGMEVSVVEGYVDDYVVYDGGLLGCDFVFNRFDCR